MNDLQSLISAEHALHDVDIDFAFQHQCWKGHVLSVQHVCDCSVPTGIPHVPVYIRGSINMAGWVAPVLDIHQYCGLTPQSLHTSRVAVVQFEDAVQDELLCLVTECFNESLQQRPKEMSQGHMISSAMFVGISIIDGQLVVLMDAEKLMAQGILDANMVKQKVTVSAT